MIKTGVNKFLMFIYYVLGALILEAFSFYVLKLGFMPQYFWYNFSIIVFIGALIFATPNYTVQYVFATIVLFVQGCLIYTNYTLYSIYGDMFTFDMLSALVEATEAATSGFVFWGVMFELISLFVTVAIIGGVLLHKAKKNKINIKQHFSILCIIMILFAQNFAITNYYLYRHRVQSYKDSLESANYVNTDAFLMETNFLKRSSYAKFGSYGYFVNMLVNALSNNHTTADTMKQKITVDYFNSGSMYNGSTLNGTDKTTFGVDRGNNVICFMMESLEWFAFGDGNYDPALQNLSNELTPNVYALIYGDAENQNDDSIVASKFFGKAKTNISEGIGIMGSYPNGLNVLDYAGKTYDKNSNALGFSLPNILQSKGYTTSYVHSNRSTFYDRNVTHGNMGFQNVIGKECLVDKDGNRIYTGDNLKWDNWAPEGEFVTHAMNYIVPENYQEKPFYTFYLNVSSHGAYLPENNVNDGDALKYMNYVKYGADDCVLDENNRYVLNKDEENATYTTWYQNIINNYQGTDPNLVSELTYYQCGVCGLDEAIGKIVAELKSKTYADGTSLYDKTTMLLYADHYSYYLNLSNRFKNIPKDEIYRTELHQIPMILSSPGVKNLNTGLTNKLTWNTRFCSAYDVVPTLLDLLGISFNENFYIGNSLFKPADTVYEINGEMRDMVIYYSNTGGIYSQEVETEDLKSFRKQNEFVTNDIIEKFKSATTTVLTKLNYIYLLDYYGIYNKITVK